MRTTRHAPSTRTSNPRKAPSSGLLVLCFALALSGCANDPDYELGLETGPGVVKSLDGLHPMVGAPFPHAWMKPSADFSAFDSVIVSEPLVVYKRTPYQYLDWSVSQRENFPMTEDQMARFRKTVVEVFGMALSRNEHLRVVTTPGPRTLQIDPAIVNLVLHAPLDQKYANVTDYQHSTADMSLLLDYRRSDTGEILARVANAAQNVQPVGSTTATSMSRNDIVNNASAIAGQIRDWATLVDDQIEAMKKVSAAEKAATATP